MTVLIGTRRNTFAVLAADRLMHGIDLDGNSFTGPTRKLVVHPTLPLAMGSVGFAYLPLGGALVVDLLAQFMAGITRSADLIMPSIMKRLTDRLHPLVREARADPRLPPDPEKNSTMIFVAMFGRQHAELARLLLGEDARVEEAHGMLNAPFALRPFYSSGTYATEDELYGAQFNSPDSVAEHLCQVVAAGIEAERELHGGQNREVGGGVDLAVVRARGAQLYSP